MYRFRLIRGRLGTCESELKPADVSSIEFFSRSETNHYVSSARKREREKKGGICSPDDDRLRLPSQSSSGQLRCSPTSERNELDAVGGERYGPPILDRKLPEPDSESGSCGGCAVLLFIGAFGPPGGVGGGGGMTSPRSRGCIAMGGSRSQSRSRSRSLSRSR